MEFETKLTDYLELLKRTVDSLDKKALDRSMNAIYDAYERGSTLYVCGNGGSAATASHLANDFNKGISYDLDKKFNVVSLTDNIATIMAIANDDSYDMVFVKQIENKLRPGDLLVAISGSGNSGNVVKAAEYCRAHGAGVLGMTGYKGGKLFALSDYHMHCPIENMQIVEDVHMIFNHMMMSIFCRMLNK